MMKGWRRRRMEMERGKRRGKIEIAGGGVSALMVRTNLSRTRFPTRPIVFILPFFQHHLSKPRYSHIISHPLPFRVYTFHSHTRPLESTTHYYDTHSDKAAAMDALRSIIRHASKRKSSAGISVIPSIAAFNDS